MRNQLAKNLVFAILITTLTTSCSSQPNLKLKWAIKGNGIKTPESVLYNKNEKVIYVSNINDNPSDKDGNGYISIISVDGKVIDSTWVTGLNAPKGMAVFGNLLYVSDIDEIVEIDIQKGVVINKYLVDGAQFLNDVTVSKEGVVYVSDSKVSNIIELKNGVVSEWCSDKLLSNCNGLLDNDSEIIFATTKDEMLKRINKETKKIKIVAEEIGHGDGVVKCDENEYIVSDWMGQVFYINSKNKKYQLLDTRTNEINAADIDYIVDSNLLIVPTFFKNSIMAYTFTR